MNRVGGRRSSNEIAFVKLSENTHRKRALQDKSCCLISLTAESICIRLKAIDRASGNAADVRSLKVWPGGNLEIPPF
jgi:hypothetical protein